MGIKRREVEANAFRAANTMVETRGTVRSVAKVCNMTKSTVYRYLTVILKDIDNDLYNEVRDIMTINKNERHIRGGIALKNILEKNKNSENVVKMTV